MTRSRCQEMVCVVGAAPRFVSTPSDVRGKGSSPIDLFRQHSTSVPAINWPSRKPLCHTLKHKELSLCSVTFELEREFFMV